MQYKIKGRTTSMDAIKSKGGYQKLEDTRRTRGRRENKQQKGEDTQNNS